MLFYPSRFRFIAILSGLNLQGDSTHGDFGTLELALSWLTGEAGGLDDQERMAAIERVIIAGNSLAEETRDKEESKAKYLTKNKEATSIEAINALDNVLERLAGSVTVHPMPGANDPANQSWPQQPLHKCLFPSKLKDPSI